MAGDVVECSWSVFFDPWDIMSLLIRTEAECKLAYHGKLSCAAMGRFAALLFPFVSAERPPNAMASCRSGASTSMSSTSDIVTRLCVCCKALTAQNENTH